MSNPILKKELQLLKGPVLAGLALLVFMLIMAALGAKFIPAWMAAPFGLLLCYLITAAFGHEIGDRLLATWVMQPKGRRELWRFKLKSLATVYGIIWLLFGICALLSPVHYTHVQQEEFSWSAMVPTFQFWALWLPWMCFGPGIYFTLKLRNPTASFWLTGAIPIMFIPVILFLVDLAASIVGFYIPTRVTLGIFLLLSLSYGAWGFWAARKQFLHWEDLGLEGKAIEFRLGKRKPTKIQTYKAPTKRPSRWSALILRELRLQQINILAGFVILATIWGIHYWHQSLINKGKFGEEVELVGLLPTVFRFLLFVLPCSIAAMCIADIRRQDAHTWELMLPLSRRFQFTVKALTCLSLGWLFAAGFPLLFDKHISFISTYESPYQNIALGVISIAAIVVSVISFYISSLTSSFLKSFSYSLGLTPMMIFFIGFTYALANAQVNFFILGLFVVPTGVVFILSGFILWWSQSNFAAAVIVKNHKTQNWKRWGWSIAVILLLLGFMIDRSWERVTMMEPQLKTSEILSIPTEHMDDWSKSNLLQQPGDSPLNQGTFAVHSDLGDNGREAAITLRRDGRLSFVNPNRLWSHFHTADAFINRPPAAPAILSRNLFYSGEIATQAIVTETEGNYHHRFILDTKGRLWMWSQEEEDHFIRSKSPLDHPIVPHQLAEGNRFRNLALTHKAVYAIDENNYLWRANYKLQDNKNKGDLEPIAQVFPEHQWKDISRCPAGMLGLKQDGTLWAWDNVWVNLGKKPGDEMIDKSIPTPLIFGDRQWNSIYPQNKSFLAEDSEGSLWIPTHVLLEKSSNIKIPNGAKRFLCKVELPGLKQYVSYDTPPFDKSVFYWIKEDGTLWKSEFVIKNLDINTDQDMIAKPTKSRQIGRRNDWVYISYFSGMTADGKIWNWDQPQLNPWNPFPARFRHKVMADLGR